VAVFSVYGCACGALLAYFFELVCVVVFYVRSVAAFVVRLVLCVIAIKYSHRFGGRTVLINYSAGVYHGMQVYFVDYRNRMAVLFQLNGFVNFTAVTAELPLRLAFAADHQVF